MTQSSTDSEGKQLTQAEAYQLDYDLHTLYQNNLPMWVITHNTKYVARPHLTSSGGVRAFKHYMLADTLEAIRAMLPPGLVCIPRYVDDDPVIVEVWL